MLASYFKEREGCEVLETPNGFITWKLEPDGNPYIVDIYVKPEARNQGVAREMADALLKQCRSVGRVSAVYGTVDPKAQTADLAIRVLHGYGMRYVAQHPDNGLLIFRKDLTWAV